MERLLTATANAEDRHFWFLGLRRFARLMLRSALPAARPLRIIDCGAGTGRNLDWLQQYGWAFGVELSPAGIAIARRHHRRVVRGNVAALPCRDDSFDLATSFDVIYSLDDETEQRALAEMHRVLKPGGIVLINAAALDVLKGSHSALANERRRYTTARLRAKLQAAGFQIVRMSYTNMATLPITLAVRLGQRMLGRGHEAAETEMAVPARPINAALAGVLRLEAALLSAASLPVGSSVMCVARKRPS
jgi:SAM-dependent methyltransferase